MEESVTLQVRTWETLVIGKGWTVFQACMNLKKKCTMKVISSDLECMKWVIIAKIFMISNSYNTEEQITAELIQTFWCCWL
jgi:hypothetical protein